MKQTTQTIKFQMPMDQKGEPLYAAMRHLQMFSDLEYKVEDIMTMIKAGDLNVLDTILKVGGPSMDTLKERIRELLENRDYLMTVISRYVKAYTINNKEDIDGCFEDIIFDDLKIRVLLSGNLDLYVEKRIYPGFVESRFMEAGRAILYENGGRETAISFAENVIEFWEAIVENHKEKDCRHDEKRLLTAVFRELENVAS